MNSKPSLFFSSQVNTEDFLVAMFLFRLSFFLFLSPLNFCYLSFFLTFSLLSPSLFLLNLNEERKAKPSLMMVLILVSFMNSFCCRYIIVIIINELRIVPFSSFEKMMKDRERKKRNKEKESEKKEERGKNDHHNHSDE